MELPVLEEYPVKHIVQFVAPTTLENVSVGQSLHTPFDSNLPGAHARHDVPLNCNPLAHVHVSLKSTLEFELARSQHVVECVFV